MKVHLLRKKDNRKITYEKINHITFGSYSFGLHRWYHLQDIKTDSSDFFDIKEYSILNIVDTET